MDHHRRHRRRRPRAGHLRDQAARRRCDVTLVAGARSLRDAAVRDLLRIADLRGALAAPAARMLHRLARGRSLPQNPKRDQRARLAVLLRGGWVAAPVGRRAADRALTLHPDVRFSLALDDGFSFEPAVATVVQRPRRRALPWLTTPDPTEA